LKIALMSTEMERGDIFFYRARVGIEEVRSLVERHQRAWAFVARVTDSAAYFREELGRRIYQTKTRGERVQPKTRPAGEGRYAIVDHDGHSHDADLFQALRVGPDELPMEPLRSGRLS
jgi:hypothetical protein